MDFNTWKQFYKWGFCTIEQLKQAVKQGMLTTEQYKEICGEDYTSAAPIQPQIESTQPKVETPSTASDEKSVAEPKKEVESTQPKVEIQNSSTASEGKSVQPENNLTQSQTETTEVKPVE